MDGVASYKSYFSLGVKSLQIIKLSCQTLKQAVIKCENNVYISFTKDISR